MTLDRKDVHVTSLTATEAFTFNDEDFHLISKLESFKCKKNC